MINLNEHIYNWVEGKVGEKIERDIEETLQFESKPNITAYAHKLVDTVFSETELQKLRGKLLAEKDFDSDFSFVGEDVIDGDVLDLSTLSLDDVKPSAAEESIKCLLQSFEYLAPDEVINQANWNINRAIMQDLLLHCQAIATGLLILKVLKRLITYSSSPKTVCEGFITLAESVNMQIEEINHRANAIESEEIYDIRDNKVIKRSSERRRVENAVDNVRREVVTRSVLLLTTAHDSMPAIWLRFNEKRLHEIIFAFVHTIAVSFIAERRNLSAFDVVTVVQPRAAWSRNWCHTALGRTLLSQALRKNRRFFNALVDTVIQGILTALKKKGKRTSGSSTPTTPTSNEETLIGFPGHCMQAGRFCHCFSILANIIQYRVGRTLFPLQTATRRRPWTVQDVVGLMVDYVSFIRQKHDQFSPCYVHHILAVGKTLVEVETEVSTARGTQALLSRRSME